jgi:hypothetical protein
MSRTPLLIVPIRDRRQRRRILTIKNCAITMLSLAVVFAMISIYSEARRGKTGDYGRLFGTQVGAPSRGVSRNLEVVHEGSVDDQSAPDPMLVAPAGGEQLLMAKSNVDQTPASTSAAAPAPIAVVPANEKVHETTIVGDGNGIVVAKPPASSTAAHPVLTGGIFKQQ